MRPRLGALILIFNLVGSKLRHRVFFGLYNSKNYEELSMSQQAVYEYLKAILPGYLKATRAEKTALLTQSENVLLISKVFAFREEFPKTTA